MANFSINPFGQGLLGQRGLGFAQQAQFQQRQSSTSATLTIDSPYGMGPGETFGGGGVKKKKAPETALAWLDRRVEEMRVRL